MKRNSSKRILCMLLVVCMVVSMLPMSVFAAASTTPVQVKTVNDTISHAELYYALANVFGTNDEYGVPNIQTAVYDYRYAVQGTEDWYTFESEGSLAADGITVYVLQSQSKSVQTGYSDVGTFIIVKVAEDIVLNEPINNLSNKMPQYYVQYEKGNISDLKQQIFNAVINTELSIEGLTVNDVKLHIEYAGGDTWPELNFLTSVFLSNKDYGSTENFYFSYNDTIYPVGGFNIKLMQYEYTVTYTDGVDNETVFADQTYTVPAESPTPAFDGVPSREGYVFTGWDKAIASTVTANVTYTATWAPYLTVTWKNWDGSVIETDSGILASDNWNPTCEAEPTRASSTQYDYSFIGWDADGDGDVDYAPGATIPAVTANAVYTAVYEQSLRTYPVHWWDEGGTPLEEDAAVEYGTVPTYDGEEPTKASDTEYDYKFSGWTPAVGAVKGEAWYTAVYEESAREYTITWKNWNGDVLATDSVAYGTVPTYTGAEPTKAADAQYSYSFKGWDKTPSAVTGDAQYVAQFESTLNTYTVTWKNWDGAVLATDSVAYGTVPSYTGAAPTKAADGANTYTHTGWAPEVVAVTGAAEYTAVFGTATNYYSVTFNYYEGSSKSENVTYETVVSQPTDPTREGYRFDGWYTDADYGAKAVFPATITADTSFYAKWIKQITVSFDTDGGSAVAAVSGDEGLTVTKPADPTKEGYAFKGWVNAQGEAYDFTAKVYEDTTIKATWAKLYNVTFLTYGGSAVEKMTVEAGQTIAEPTTTREGYKFDGWYSNPSYTAKFDFAQPITKNTTVYAKWLAYYTVSFNSNGGSAVEAQTVLEGETAAEPVTTQTGYEFLGWYDASGAKFDFNTAVVDDITLTAQWQKIIIKYTVSFDSNGGSEVADQVVEETGVTTEPAAPTREGYKFEGWYIVGDGSSFVFGTAITKDYALEAKWSVDTEIALKTDSLSLSYDVLSNEAVLNAVYDKLLANGVEIEGEVALESSVEGLPVGEYTAKLVFAGYEEDGVIYYSSSAEFALEISKAAASVVVKSQTVKYGEALEQTPIIQANCTTIDVLAGIDAADENALLGLARVGVPNELYSYVEYYAGTKGYDLKDLSIDEAKSIFALAAEQLGYAETVEAYKESIEKLISTLETIQAELAERGVNTELLISVLDKSTFNASIPTDIGLYVIASISADDNYTSDMDAGYLVITPDGVKVELAWEQTDDNYIITLDKFSDFDLGATATVVGESKEALDAVENHLEYLVIGVDENKELVINRVHNGEDIDASVVREDLGVYAELAYIANWGNTMYFAEPIARPIIVTPNVADVAFLDENGNENYARVFTYDGEPKSVTVTVDGKEVTEGLKFKYIGLDTTADGWYRVDAPTDAGVYAAVAVYTEYNDNGLYKAGGAVCVMIIEPATPEFALEDTQVCYDGEEHFADMVMDKSYDFISIAIDRDSNTAYVDLPDDLEAHAERIVSMLPAEYEEKVKELFNELMAEFDGDVTSATVKAKLNAILDEIIAADLTGEAKALAEQVIDKLIEEVENSEDVQALIAELQAKLDALEAKVREEIPDNLDETIENYIRKIVTAGETAVEIDIDQVKADIKTKIAEYKDKVPESVYNELVEMVDELIVALENDENITALTGKVEAALTKLETLDVTDAKLIVKAVLGLAASQIDTEQAKAILEDVAAKFETLGYVDYAKSLIKDIAGIYEVELDVDSYVAKVEAEINSLVDTVKAKVEAGELSELDLAEIEAYSDSVLEQLKTLLDKIPDDYTFKFGSNPVEEGEYDCYAINISANYKPVFAEATLVIGHVLEKVEAVEATCEEDGNKAYYICVCESCEDCDCGWFWDEEATQPIENEADVVIPAIGHDWDDGEITTEPTCTKEGVKTYTCRNDAEHTYTEPVEALGHTEGEAVEEKRVEASCEEDGSYDTVVYCSVCGEELSRETSTIPAIGHDWDDGEITTEPTCTKEGVKTYTCRNDAEHTYTEPVEALGHTEGEAVEEKRVEASCEEDGSYDTVVYCSVCGEELSRETSTIPTIGHDWDDGEITTEPTCTEEGVKTYTCQNDAAHTYTEPVEALGHNEGEAVEEKRVEATCEEDGSYDTVVYCSVCKEELSRETSTIPAIGHDWDDGEITTEPTCTEEGVKTYTCRNDAEHTYTEPVDALGHTEGEAVEEKRVEATCEEDGSYDTVVYCSVCGEELSRETSTIPAIGHAYGDWTDCEDGEQHEKVCANDASHVEYADHNWDNGVVTKQPTYTEEGEKTYTCGDCGAIKTEAIPVKERPVVPDVPVTPPVLNTEDHFAYIIGYSDGTVRPSNNITRAEVATIFFRLLTEETREAYWSTTNDFSDVADGAWYNVAISTLCEAGIINGYADGTFRPNAPITRAEFATIAARFSNAEYDGECSFTDVSENHWAADTIALAQYLGYINGYPDGSFKPGANITRAEGITLINRVLERAVKEENMLDDMVTFSDNLPGTWYYEAIQEATNSHEYTRSSETVTDQDFKYEKWVEMLETPDWAAIEKEWIQTLGE